MTFPDGEVVEGQRSGPRRGRRHAHRARAQAGGDAHRRGPLGRAALARSPAARCGWRGPSTRWASAHRARDADGGQLARPPRARGRPGRSTRGASACCSRSRAARSTRRTRGRGSSSASADAVIRITGPADRCVVITRHPETGERDLDTLRLIRGYRPMRGRYIDFGMFARSRRPGRSRWATPSSRSDEERRFMSTARQPGSSAAARPSSPAARTASAPRSCAGFARERRGPRRRARPAGSARTQRAARRAGAGSRVDLRDDDSVAHAFARRASSSGRSTSSWPPPAWCPPGRGIDDASTRTNGTTSSASTRAASCAASRRRIAAMADGGAIVVIASQNAWRGSPAARGLHGQQARRARPRPLRRARARARSGIRVNAIGPGSVATEAYRGRLRRREAEGGLERRRGARARAAHDAAAAPGDAGRDRRRGALPRERSRVGRHRPRAAGRRSAELSRGRSARRGRGMTSHAAAHVVLASCARCRSRGEGRSGRRASCGR